MRKFHSIAALCGDGLRPELQALFDRTACQPRGFVFRRNPVPDSQPTPKPTGGVP